MKRNILIALFVFMILEMGIIVPNLIRMVGFQNIGSLVQYNRFSGGLNAVTLIFRLVFPLSIIVYGVIHDSGKKILYAHMVLLSFALIEAFIVIISGEYYLYHLNLSYPIMLLGIVLFNGGWLLVSVYALMHLIRYLRVETNQLLKLTLIIITLMMFVQIPILGRFVRLDLYLAMDSTTSYILYNFSRLFVLSLLPFLYSYSVYLIIDRDLSQTSMYERKRIY